MSTESPRWRGKNGPACCSAVYRLSARFRYEPGVRYVRRCAGLGYAVTAIEVQADGGWLSQARQVDVAFIALHGKFGEDGTVQAVLEVLGIPYTGSGVLASALAMNKPMAKRIWHTHAIPTPAWEVIDTRAGGLGSSPRWSFPVVVKPSAEGSSVGGEYRALQPMTCLRPWPRRPGLTRPA